MKRGWIELFSFISLFLRDSKRDKRNKVIKDCGVIKIADKTALQFTTLQDPCLRDYWKETV